MEIAKGSPRNLFLSRFPKGALSHPTFFLGGFGTLLKQTTEKGWYPYSSLSGGSSSGELTRG